MALVVSIGDIVPIRLFLLADRNDQASIPVADPRRCFQCTASTRIPLCLAHEACHRVGRLSCLQASVASREVLSSDDYRASRSDSLWVARE